MRTKEFIKNITDGYQRLPRIAKLGILSIPILVFVLPILLSGRGVIPGDYDMQIQMTEAARRSIVQYHQIPLWNPWISGGTPLFADPQFGLFTPQTILSFFVGASYAWKLTLAFYFFVGFFSMRALIRKLTENNETVSALTSYIWVFGSFFALRATGHFTFLLLSLLPLAVLFALEMGESRRKRIYLMLLFAYSFNAAMHYSSVLMLIAVVAILALELASQIVLKFMESGRDFAVTKGLAIKNSLATVKNVLFVCVWALVINLPKFYLGGQYLASNSVNRSGFYEPFIGLWNGIRAIALPYEVGTYPRMPFGLFEASVYIGSVTFLLAVVSTLVFLVLRAKRRDLSTLLSSRVPSLLIFATSTFVLGVGGIFYAGLRLFPIFSSMRVSTRWFFLTSFTILLLLAITLDRLKNEKISRSKLSYLLYPLLFVSFFQVYAKDIRLQRGNWTRTSLVDPYTNSSSSKDSTIYGEKLWQTDISRHYYALTQSTLNNKDQLVADNALVDTTVLGTIRCDQDEAGCGFVLTNNAKVRTWTPNYIILDRTGSGPIELNVNPGKHWKVNGKKVYTKKVVSSTDRFIINDDSKVITLKYSLI